MAKPTKMEYLTESEYVHIINRRNGKVRLLDGPANLRRSLGLFQKVLGTIQKKMVLGENQYVIILNPYDLSKRKYKYGDREVRTGPMTFSLYPEEKIDKTRQVGVLTFNGSKVEGHKVDDSGNAIDEEDYYTEDPDWDGIRNAYVLKHNKALLVKALRDFSEGTGKEKKEHKAGDLWVITGPRLYIPDKYVQVRRKVKAISLVDHEGVYVKNIKDGSIMLQKGPKVVMLNEDEEFWKKIYTDSEIEAIGFREQNNLDFTRAHPLWVLENQVCRIMTETRQVVVPGPVVL